MASKHVKALRGYITFVQYGRTLKCPDIDDVETAADHMESLERQLQIAKTALGKFGEAGRNVLADMRKAKAKKGKS
jgi:hypothetical protein